MPQNHLYLCNVYTLTLIISGSKVLHVTKTHLQSLETCSEIFISMHYLACLEQTIPCLKCTPASKRVLDKHVLRPYVEKASTNHRNSPTLTASV